METELTESMQSRLETIRQVLKIDIDGDWDEEMIGTAFDNLERLLLGGEPEERPEKTESGQRRSRSKAKARTKAKPRAQRRTSKS